MAGGFYLLAVRKDFQLAGAGVNARRRFIEIRCGLSRFPVYVKSVKDEVLQAKPVYGPLPALGLPVQVQCDGFKCMAYRNKEGKWVDFFTHEILTHVLGVVPG